MSRVLIPIRIICTLDENFVFSHFLQINSDSDVKRERPHHSALMRRQQSNNFNKGKGKAFPNRPGVAQRVQEV